MKRTLVQARNKTLHNLFSQEFKVAKLGQTQAVDCLHDEQS